jgi:hypothetical protein
MKGKFHRRPYVVAGVIAGTSGAPVGRLGITGSRPPPGQTLLCLEVSTRHIILGFGSREALTTKRMLRSFEGRPLNVEKQTLVNFATREWHQRQSYQGNPPFLVHKVRGTQCKSLWQCCPTTQFPSKSRRMHCHQLGSHPHFSML